MNRFFPLIAILFILFFADNSTRGGTTILSTGDFVDSEWTTQVVNFSSNGSSSASTQTTGGNPGAFRQNDMNLSSGQNTAIRNIQLWTAAPYTPATQGAVQSAVVSFDLNSISPNPTYLWGMAVQQDNHTYLVFNGAGVEATSNWNYHTSIDAFVTFSPPNFGQTPVINWTDGDAITFGFWVETVGGPAQTQQSNVVGFDNFTVTINLPTPPPTVTPEPSTLTLLGIGIAGIAGYGCRRRKKPA